MGQYNLKSRRILVQHDSLKESVQKIPFVLLAERYRTLISTVQMVPLLTQAKRGDVQKIDNGIPSGT